LTIPESALEEIASPYQEPRIACRSQAPRQVSSNLTLIDGKTFLSTTVAGDIVPSVAPDVGFFHDDTRFLSHLELCIAGRQALVLSSNTEKTYMSQIELTAGSMTLRNSFNVAENTIHIRRQQLLNHQAFFDRLRFQNFNTWPVELRVEIFLAADFVDVFQVRGVPRKLHGQYFRPVKTGEHNLSFFYRGLDGVMRQTSIEISPSPAALEERCAKWDLMLHPMKEVQLNLTVVPFVGDSKSPVNTEYGDCLQERRERYRRWESDSASFSSNNGIFDAALKTAVSDFHSLQIQEGTERVVAAGVPWFATLFGRDSIIASYQALLLNPQLAVDTLRVLARYQGKEYSDWQDEEPGKILHEYRNGEMTRCNEMPFGPYYGSVDSTPLFLILLSETYAWTADENLVEELLPAAYRALDWIDQYGDLDADGLVEYRRRSLKGLVNQAWKDSWDANMRSDGSIAPPPIATVEVQGYVYCAKHRMSLLLRAFGDHARADKLKKDAVDLADRLENAFWRADEHFYAMALDGHKKPLNAISSNPGHLLFTGVLGKEHVRRVVERMMRDDMFTGWGWRTLSDREPTFNPLSYHRGSVWPHDNSLIAYGMALNEFRAPALKVLTAMFQAAIGFRDYRLPELFCGVQRREHDEPVHYPISCSPQAWASGAWFLILTAVLGIRPSAPTRKLKIINPQLPDWLDSLQIRNMVIGKSRVGLDFSLRNGRTFCNVVSVEGEKLVVSMEFRK